MIDGYGIAVLMIGSFLAGAISMLCGVMLTTAIEDWNKKQSDAKEQA